MRLAEHDLSPAARLSDMEARQQAAVEKVLPHVKLLDKGNFKKAIKALPHWTRAREATRDRAVRTGATLKRVFRELVRRAAAKSGIDDPRMVAMLRFNDELPQYLRDPASLVRRDPRALGAARTLCRRERRRSSSPRRTRCRASSRWKQRRRAKPKAAVRGRRSRATAARRASCAVARGSCSIRPTRAGSTPGDILVAPLTDPAWTPLFLPAAAVVVNVGALMSHAVIVSRELGIPCVVAVDGATERIADGAMLEVDGTAGTVTVLAPDRLLPYRFRCIVSAWLSCVADLAGRRHVVAGEIAARVPRGGCSPMKPNSACIGG